MASSHHKVPGRPTLPYNKTYGETLVKDSGYAHLGDIVKNVKIVGGVHFHYRTDEAELLQQTLSELRSTTTDKVLYEETIIQLQSISEIFGQAERIEAQCGPEDRQWVDTLRVLAGTTSSTLRDFGLRLSRASSSVSAYEPFESEDALILENAQTVALNDEVHKLHQFAVRQLLQLNAILQIMIHGTTRQLAQKHTIQHQSLMLKAKEQTRAIQYLSSHLDPIASDLHESRLAIAELSSMVRMSQGPAFRTPQFMKADNINLFDALNRSHQLPYTFFKHWQTFESFVRTELGRSDIPGGFHIEKGRFAVTRASREDQALTPSNWAASVYPGCELSMTIIFSALKLSLLRCPRPGCCNSPSQPVENGAFLTCSRCNLVYRFDRSFELPPLADEEQNLAQRQLMDDVQRFGQREVPAEQANLPKDGMHMSHERGIDGSPLELSNYNFSSDMPKDPTGESVEQMIESGKPACPTSVDWNSGASGLEAWLNTSAMPMNEPVSMEKDEFELEAQQRQKEYQDLAALQKVHFVALAPETKPIIQSVPQYRNMSLESQIYLRKIVDKFPALPIPLAERFAKASVARKNRLKGLRPPAVEQPTDTDMQEAPAPEPPETDLGDENISHEILETLLKQQNMQRKRKQGSPEDHPPPADTANVEHNTGKIQVKPFSCNICRRGFHREQHLKRHHRQLHSVPKTFECSECGKRFSYSGNLRMHQRMHAHSINNEPQIGA